MKILQIDVFAKHLPMVSGYNMSSSTVGDRTPQSWLCAQMQN